jgi:hypothetical protein
MPEVEVDGSVATSDQVRPEVDRAEDQLTRLLEAEADLNAVLEAEAGKPDRDGLDRVAKIRKVFRSKILHRQKVLHQGSILQISISAANFYYNFLFPNFGQISV